MTIYGSRTVHEGSRVAIWSRSGKVKIVDGPARVTLVFQRCVPLRQYRADQSQYLAVRKRAGPIEIKPGPCTVFFDPVEDEGISVENAVQIDASQALVVYRNVHAAEGGSVKAVAHGGGDGGGGDRGGGARSVDRRVVRGPARFIPTADEWCHEFSWSGVPKDGSKTTVQPNANKFKKLSVIPTSMYHNVSEVRTNDDTLITVKLMLFFQLDSIEKMLACTNDPIADFVNAASADVIAFCSGLNYENFLTLTGELNKLETFSQLTTRAHMIGYTISKVVFRGFQAGEKLQAMHDEAIQERTRLRLLEETQEQQQRAEDMKLEGERRRAKMQACAMMLPCGFVRVWWACLPMFALCNRASCVREQRNFAPTCVSDRE